MWTRGHDARTPDRTTALHALSRHPSTRSDFVPFRHVVAPDELAYSWRFAEQRRDRAALTSFGSGARTLGACSPGGGALT